MSDSKQQAIRKALGSIPSGLFILTSSHEDRRLGMMAGFVQQICLKPAMVAVSVAKGRAIMPLISESRRFALCQLGEDDRMMYRKFSSDMDGRDDPFLGMDLIHGQTPGLPILKQSMAYLECEVSCHMDVEGDHDLFVGRVLAAGYEGGKPQIHLRDDGFSY